MALYVYCTPLQTFISGGGRPRLLSKCKSVSLGKRRPRWWPFLLLSLSGLWHSCHLRVEPNFYPTLLSPFSTYRVSDWERDELSHSEKWQSKLFSPGFCQLPYSGTINDTSRFPSSSNLITGYGIKNPCYNSGKVNPCNISSKEGGFWILASNIWEPERGTLLGVSIGVLFRPTHSIYMNSRCYFREQQERDGWMRSFRVAITTATTTTTKVAVSCSSPRLVCWWRWHIIYCRCMRDGHTFMMMMMTIFLSREPVLYCIHCLLLVLYYCS